MRFGGTRARRLATAIALAVVSTSCAHCMHTPPPRVAKLKVVADPPDTTVYINDRFIGSAKVLSKKAKELKPGVKLITFKAPGYFPHDVRLELPAGETTLTMKLRQIPP